MNSTVRQIIFWIVIIGGALLLYQIVYKGSGTKETTLSYSDFVSKIQEKQIKQATIEDTQITGQLATGENFKTELVSNNSFIQNDLAKQLKEATATVTMKSGSSNIWLINLLGYAPLLVFIGLWIFMMRQMQSGGNKALS